MSCAAGGPTGATSFPPTLSCSNISLGRASVAAEIIILSKGDSLEYPREPSLI